jgi:hypothetical protein
MQTELLHEPLKQHLSIIETWLSLVTPAFGAACCSDSDDRSFDDNDLDDTDQFDLAPPS